MTRRRKPDAAAMAGAMRAHYATPFSTAFPQVASLSLSITFEGDTPNTSGAPHIVNVSIENATVPLLVSCPQRECVDGGFDLSNAIGELVHARKSSGHVRLVCQGWQDEERRNQYRCHYGLECDIAVVYKSNADEEQG
jgi:hypothetical protein